MHVLSDYQCPVRELREEYFAALEVCLTRCCCTYSLAKLAVIYCVQTTMLQIGVQRQVDCVRQGISEVFPLSQLVRMSGLDLIEVIGANPRVQDEDWEQMIAMMVSKNDSPASEIFLSLFRDVIRSVKNSEEGDDFVRISGSKVDVQRFRRDFCTAIFCVPQVDTNKAIKLTTEVKDSGLPCHWGTCFDELQIRASRSRLVYQTSFVSRAQGQQASFSNAAEVHEIHVEGAARLQFGFTSHPNSASFQGNRDIRASQTSMNSIDPALLILFFRSECLLETYWSQKETRWLKAKRCQSPATRPHCKCPKAAFIA